jgi:tRNA pseudouridine55 synthase
LAHDLGQVLGCGAHLFGLVRLVSGRFRLEEAVALDDFARAAAAARWQDLLHPIDAALGRFMALHLDADAAKRLCSGQAIPQHVADRDDDTPSEGKELARAYGPDEAFLAIVSYDPAARVWRPRKVFCSPECFS